MKVSPLFCLFVFFSFASAIYIKRRRQILVATTESARFLLGVSFCPIASTALTSLGGPLLHVLYRKPRASSVSRLVVFPVARALVEHHRKHSGAPREKSPIGMRASISAETEALFYPLLCAFVNECGRKCNRAEFLLTQKKRARSRPMFPVMRDESPSRRENEKEREREREKNPGQSTVLCRIIAFSFYPREINQAVDLSADGDGECERQRGGP